MTEKKIIIAVMILLTIIATACYFPEIISSDSAIATQVSKALDEALEETAAVEVDPTYTPYPTYTPVPTATVQPFHYNNDNMHQPPQPGGTNPIPPLSIR